MSASLQGDRAVLAGPDARIPAVENGRNAADRVARTLREELLSGRYEAGERLKEEELAARFRTGRYTIRAAFQSLGAAGLLDLRANRGASVPSLTRQRVDALSDYREVLEVGALRLALKQGADFSAFVTATQALLDLPVDAPWVDVVLTHQRLHHELVAAAGNERLLQAYAQCEEELLFVVSTTRPDYTARRLAELHRELLIGVERGGETAIEALQRDLSIGRAAVLHVLT
jgi:DNA-binding GntR family transcriptional regulator